MSARHKKSKNKKDSILHRDIKDLEIGRSLKRLANYKVTEWELRDLPHLKVIEWELPDILGKRQQSNPPGNRKNKKNDPKKLRALADQLGQFTHFVAAKLINDPGRIELNTQITRPDLIGIRLTLDQPDAAAIIGHGGHTAAAIRRLLTAFATTHNAEISFKIIERPIQPQNK